MKIEEGKYYVTRGGDVVGPICYNGHEKDEYIWYTINNGEYISYDNNGKFYKYSENDADLVGEFKENSVAEDNFKTYDISSETWREYVYAHSVPEMGSVSYHINNPVTLFIKNDESGTSHRIIDDMGVTHRPEREWIAIRWFAPDVPVSF